MIVWHQIVGFQTLIDYVLTKVSREGFNVCWKGDFTKPVVQGQHPERVRSKPWNSAGAYLWFQYPKIGYNSANNIAYKIPLLHITWLRWSWWSFKIIIRIPKMEYIFWAKLKGGACPGSPVQTPLPSWLLIPKFNPSLVGWNHQWVLLI